MNSVQYFELGKSVDPKELGVDDLYQVTDIEGGYTVDTLDDYAFLSRQKLAESLPNLERFILTKDAKATDILSNMFLKLSNGLFVNDKVKAILDTISVANARLHKSSIQYDKETLHYYFYHIVESPGLIDYEKSEFYITDVLGLKKLDSIKFKSAQEYYDKCEELGGGYVLHESVKLKKGYDLFRLPWKIDLCISGRLRELLIENKVTGIEIKPSKIQFFLD